MSFARGRPRGDEFRGSVRPERRGLVKRPRLRVNTGSEPRLPHNLLRRPPKLAQDTSPLRLGTLGLVSRNSRSSEASSSMLVPSLPEAHPRREVVWSKEPDKKDTGAGYLPHPSAASAAAALALATSPVHADDDGVVLSWPRPSATAISRARSEALEAWLLESLGRCAEDDSVSETDRKLALSKSREVLSTLLARWHKERGDNREKTSLIVHPQFADDKKQSNADDQVNELAAAVRDGVQSPPVRQFFDNLARHTDTDSQAPSKPTLIKIKQQPPPPPRSKWYLAYPKSQIIRCTIQFSTEKHSKVCVQNVAQGIARRANRNLVAFGLEDRQLDLTEATLPEAGIPLNAHFIAIFE